MYLSIASYFDIFLTLFHASHFAHSLKYRNVGLCVLQSPNVACL